MPPAGGVGVDGNNDRARPIHGISLGTAYYQPIAKDPSSLNKPIWPCISKVATKKYSSAWLGGEHLHCPAGASGVLSMANPAPAAWMETLGTASIELFLAQMKAISDSRSRGRVTRTGTAGYCAFGDAN